ncbi:MAG TPA: 30S ribosome-binding factor RbfA [Sedimentisphaerales bacterium]|nr:30S ribosome-binding factor RbfA [Sedimentisphaerales bacterium]
MHGVRRGRKRIMASRRQERVARVIKEVVSNAIARHLSDPRIDGFVSITHVDMSPDLRNAEVYLSIFGKDASAQNKTFLAIDHAKARIQSMVAGKLQSRFCPVLRFHKDEQFKKTLEIMRLIDQAADEYKDKDEQNASDEANS